MTQLIGIYYFQIIYNKKYYLLKYRLVEIPFGKTYYIHPIYIENASNLTILVDGRLIAHDDLAAWPDNFLSLIHLYNSKDFTLTG